MKIHIIVSYDQNISLIFLLKMDPMSGCDIRLMFTLEPRAQNLRQGYVMKTSFGTLVSRIGLGSFVDINIFVMKNHVI